MSARHAPRFKEPVSEEAEAEAAQKRRAYKEQCERDVLEFQKSLELEGVVSCRIKKEDVKEQTFGAETLYNVSQLSAIHPRFLAAAF